MCFVLSGWGDGFYGFDKYVKNGLTEKIVVYFMTN
jgi:hypothetical protein